MGFDLNDDHCRMQIVSFIVFHRIMKIMGIWCGYNVNTFKDEKYHYEYA